LVGKAEPAVKKTPSKKSGWTKNNRVESPDIEELEVEEEVKADERSQASGGTSMGKSVCCVGIFAC
jgi:hypothetical protein